jgi:NAD(P)-dependent dehydrogenase (short-subunit alcohol dehydrogenase family)
MERAMPTTLKNRVALVTGAGRGIGQAISIGLVAMGATVALLSRTKSELDKVAGEVRDLGGTALVVPADVGDLEQAQAAAKRVLDELGTVDVLVNNAGVQGPLGLTSTTDPAEWAAAMSINVIGAVTLTRVGGESSTFRAELQPIRERRSAPTATHT